MAKLQNAINQSIQNNSIVAQNVSPFNTSLGPSAAPSVTGVQNVAVGQSAMLAATSAQSCTAIGAGCMASTVSSQNCTAVGASALSLNASSDNVTAIGNSALLGSTGGRNTAIGASALGSLTTGAANIAAGYLAGNSYTSSESNNIVIGSSGVVGESNKVRIGTPGSGSGQQNAAFIVGPLNISGAITTMPVSSSTASAAFGAPIFPGTAVQNTTGYDLLVNLSMLFTAATGATIVMGVGPTATPTTNAVTAPFTIAASPPPINFIAIVPNNYYLLVNTTGTITVTNINSQACPL